MKKVPVWGFPLTPRTADDHVSEGDLTGEWWPRNICLVLRSFHCHALIVLLSLTKPSFWGSVVLVMLKKILVSCSQCNPDTNKYALSFCLYNNWGIFHPLYAKFWRHFKCDMWEKPSFMCGIHSDATEAYNSVPFSILYSVFWRQNHE